MAKISISSIPSSNILLVVCTFVGLADTQQQRARKKRQTNRQKLIDIINSVLPWFETSLLQLFLLYVLYVRAEQSRAQQLGETTEHKQSSNQRRRVRLRIGNSFRVLLSSAVTRDSETVATSTKSVSPRCNSNSCEFDPQVGSINWNVSGRERKSHFPLYLFLLVLFFTDFPYSWGIASNYVGRGKPPKDTLPFQLKSRQNENEEERIRSAC